MSHCKSAAIWDSFGHKGAFFLGDTVTSPSLYNNKNIATNPFIRTHVTPRSTIPAQFLMTSSHSRNSPLSLPNKPLDWIKIGGRKVFLAKEILKCYKIISSYLPIPIRQL